MALASSPLPSLASLNLEVTMLPFILAIFLNDWCLTTSAIIFFEIVIREGFGTIGSPFPFPNPSDEFDGRRIMNAVYVIYIMAFAFLGKLLIILLKFPTFLNVMSVIPKQMLSPNEKHGHKSYLVFIVSLLYILLLTLGTFITYKVLLDNNQTVAAIAFTNIFPLFMFILGWLMYRYWGSLSKSLEKQFESLDPKYTKPYFRTMLILYFCTVGFIFILGVFIQSIVCFFQFDVNFTALTSPVLWLVILIYIIIMIWISRRVMKRYGATKPKKIEPNPEETEVLERKIEKEQEKPSIQIFHQ